jgi:DUF2917 family protein
MSEKEFSLPRGALLVIEARPGDRLRVALGEVWVTQHEDTNDYVLEAGESMNLSAKGKTLVVAHTPASLVLVSGTPSLIGERIGLEPGPSWIEGVRALLRRTRPTPPASSGTSS